MLNRAECSGLLGNGGMGRVAVTVGALPTIFPVNYAILDGDVVFRTTPGTKLAAAVHDAVVAFEVDDVDRVSHTGWTVVVIGPSREISNPADIAAAQCLLLSRRKGGAGGESVVRLRADLVSGRRFETEPEPGRDGEVEHPGPSDPRGAERLRLH